MINLAEKLSWRKFKYNNLIVQSLINIYYRKFCTGVRGSCRNLGVDIAELEQLVYTNPLEPGKVDKYSPVGQLTPCNSSQHLSPILKPKIW
jgi:hypothetical protein